MSSFKYVLVFGLLAVSLRNVRAISAEEKQKIHAATLPNLVECSSEFGVSMDDIKKAEKSGSVGTLDPCLMGCVFKKSELIDDQGLYDADKAEEFTKKYLSDEADQKKANEIISKCKSVNEREVTDGDKGCDRAGFLLECFRPFKDMFDN